MQARGDDLLAADEAAPFGGFFAAGTGLIEKALLKINSHDGKNSSHFGRMKIPRSIFLFRYFHDRHNI
ncbi:hypothetical protein GsuE55_21190 [Geobacillus subterraneus]|uniref:Uncharacterized protein n=1 Tax=Geobacillus subterraneus TaxID=129338 RepID=A0A679FU73_9BACL|nr:hypothetical protein B4113_3520 [Geobacillus sp. B4113_201601]BBW97286.1 hypothetical protein GsuE55_21190 [Geobacillus subterraneus]